VLTRTIEIAAADGPLELSVAEAGAGGRPLALVHGFTGAKEDLTDRLDELAARGWHVVAPDQRGHGASPKPDHEGAYSFDVFVDDLLALFDALGWQDRPVVALGHSMGGMVVQTAILRAPERFAGIVLMDTSHRTLKGVDPEVVELAAALARDEGMAALLAAQALVAGPPAPAHERLLATRPGYGEFSDGKLLASSPAMYGAMLRAITDTVAGIDRLPDLGRVAVPALVLVGEQDRPFLKPSLRMADAIPDAELVVIADAAHSPQFEAPEAWWAALSSWLDRLPR
jgi:pimeloyl-ACP methyl ester carboxylesterase